MMHPAHAAPVHSPDSLTAIVAAAIAGLTTVFIALKLTGAIDWSWWWVWSPMLISLAIVLLIIVAALVIAARVR